MKAADLRAETIAIYSDEQGRLMEIDHLGICCPEQAGTYVVYRDGEQTAEFCPELLETVEPEYITTAELVRLAKEAVEDADRAGA